MLPARLRTGAQWSDTCILNISSRGLLIHSARAGPQGSTVELRRGDHVIVARVVWREGARVGLHADEQLPVEQIMSLGQCQTLQLTARAGPAAERRLRPRAEADDARLRGRAMEFVSVGVIALCLALTIWSIAQEALASPMAAVRTALGG
jgi:hypothetical protein